MNELKLRAAMVDYARRLHARGWVANHDGNISFRLGDGKFLITPTATSKAEVTADSLLIVDDKGARIAGTHRPFSEMGLHLAVYRGRPDVQAVMHAHPPVATGFAVAGVSLADPLLAEAVVSLGCGIPTVPFTAPGAAAVGALSQWVASHDAVLLAQHGVMAWGASIEQAYLRMELVEHLAQICLTARQLGGAQPLPREILPALLEARRKAGLGLAAEREAAAPSGPAFRATSAPVNAPDSRKLTDVIREEIAHAIKNSR